MSDCNCADTAPTYPVFRGNLHLPDCQHFRVSPGDEATKELSGMVGIPASALSDMRIRAVCDVARRHIRAVESACLQLEILARDNPDNPLSGGIRAILRHQTELFPPL